MQPALHAVGVGARTLGATAVLVVFAVLLGYSLVVFGIVVVQGVNAFGT